MLRKIKQMSAWFGITPSFHKSEVLTNKIQEDPRTQESIKRTRKVFEDNKDIINARALRPHSFNCNDELECEGCWEFTSDKIVGEPYEIGRNFKSIQINKKQ